MAVDDLEVLPADLQARTRRHQNGEVSWHLNDAASVVTALADAGRVLLGIDVRSYAADGSFIETAWSVYNGADPNVARDLALSALAREDLPGDWALLTWGPSAQPSA